MDRKIGTPVLEPDPYRVNPLYPLLPAVGTPASHYVIAEITSGT